MINLCFLSMTACQKVKRSESCIIASVDTLKFKIDMKWSEMLDQSRSYDVMQPSLQYSELAFSAVSCLHKGVFINK